MPSPTFGQPAPAMRACDACKAAPATHTLHVKATAAPFGGTPPLRTEAAALVCEACARHISGAVYELAYAAMHTPKLVTEGEVRFR